MDQDFPTLLQIGSFDKHLPCCQGDKRNGCGLLHGQIGRLHCDIGLVHGDILCKCPDAILGRACIDRVTGLELPDIGPDPDHDARYVVAENQRKAIWQSLNSPSRILVSRTFTPAA